MTAGGELIAPTWLQVEQYEHVAQFLKLRSLLPERTAEQKALMFFRLGSHG